ncbi:MAG: anthranilate phosphoribosyltransferase [Actinomycetota bacterium]|nr:anthranilate phosphoribosyltransferase [Actinomycetota bacterium]
MTLHDGISWPALLTILLNGEHLSEQQAANALGVIMRGEATPVEVAAFLVALRAKGETSEEIAGFVRAMLAHAERLELDGVLVDTCGTGGDRAGTFNISTIAALVVAAAGVQVAKHGNRAASGRCGSADLLEAWGVAIDLPPTAVGECVAEVGIGFLFARRFHPAMRHVAAVRAELGVPTVFNVLGPLTNPAGIERQVVGVADARLAPLVADALVHLGRRHALVFRGEDGLDELTTTGPSRLWEIRDGRATESLFDPASLGLPRSRREDLVGGEVEENARIAEAVLAGEPGPGADVVALNAAAALYVSGTAPRIRDGLEMARDVLTSGAAGKLRDRWVAVSQELAGG